MYKYKVVVKADYSNADYVYSFLRIDKNSIEDLKRIAKVIKECPKNYNWDMQVPYDVYTDSYYEDKLSEDDIDLISLYIPYHNFGIHTIKSIRIITITDEDELL